MNKNLRIIEYMYAGRNKIFEAKDSASQQYGKLKHFRSSEAKKILILTSAYLLVFCLISLVSLQNTFADLPASSNFKLDGYSFGGGGTSNNTTSSSYGVYGTLGEVEFGRPSSTNYKAGSGLTYLLSANVPSAPTLSTPGNNYDRIQFSINTSSNPTDTTYALEISTSSNFSSGNSFVNSDGTLGTTLITSDFQTTSNWSSNANNFITGLASATTYYVRVKARQGKYSETDWGPSNSITTNDPSLTFSLDSNTLTFSNLNPGNSYTDSSKTNVLTTSTNAYNGYIVYGKVNQALTAPGGSTIANYVSPNSAPTTWSGTGFGYNTSDTSLSGGTANRFSGSKYAGFTTNLNGDPVADNPGPVTTTPISNEQFTISYRITGDSITPAGTYTNVILYSIVPSY